MLPQIKLTFSVRAWSHTMPAKKIASILSVFTQIYIYIRKKRLLSSGPNSRRACAFRSISQRFSECAHQMSPFPTGRRRQRRQRPDGRRESPISRSIIRVSHKHPCHLLPRSLALVTLIDDLSCLAIAAFLLSAGKCMHVRGDTMSLDFKFCGE